MQPFGATVGGPTERLGAADKWMTMMVTIYPLFDMSTSSTRRESVNIQINHHCVKKKADNV